MLLSRRTICQSLPILATACSSADDPTLVLRALSEPELSARLLMRSAVVPERAGRYLEALGLVQTALTLVRGRAYAEICHAYRAVLLGEYSRERGDPGALAEAVREARSLRGQILHDGDLKQLRYQLACLEGREEAAPALVRLSLDVWQQPGQMLTDGTWHWARGGFIVKSLETLILSQHRREADQLAQEFLPIENKTFHAYRALEWEWEAIKTKLYASPEQQRAFRRRACQAGYVRQAVIAL
ncbi:MAG: hypothetical protein IRZ31_19320 [Thermogemmatispora sp.]|uniref:MalT-like TPR region domain-containing protein n=1 Tax=Thermogemmatispora tikiterensis TaxID=1825093 RepID=A0A328VTR4_9CHLR|nr:MULTISPECIES: hypothetical protein [Thermogemmatispora]MBX5459050.1 hypothetical protein [Thermogemmatispora sp.]RAQ97505.1 hypothetical protein A4R35_18355 [Thermogemmatispora tikiterensis]